jgi:hypothetical protein
MESTRFDVFTRALVGRRFFFLTALAVGLADFDPATARKRRRRRKYRPECGAGQRLCRDHCVPADGCCTDSECRPRGECASCQGGKCLPDGQKCLAVAGPCSICDAATLSCEPAGDGHRCGDCRICQAGACVGCLALGECAGCNDGECHADGRICVTAYGPCAICDSTTLTCVRDRILCGSPPPGSGRCYSAGFVCCSDSTYIGCDTSDRCCDGECVDFANHQAHCGACGNRCLANQLCVNGACSCSAYQSGTKFCESANRCIRDDQTCCGRQACASNHRCCGSGDTAFCWSGLQCP